PCGGGRARETARGPIRRAGARDGREARRSARRPLRRAAAAPRAARARSPRAPRRRSSGLFGELRKLLRLVLRAQRLDELVQLAVHDAIDLVEGEVDAVVGHPALRKVVRADALRAVTRADERLARGSGLRLLLAHLLVADSRRQHPERLLAVLVLRARVLALDHDPGGQVRHSDGRLRLVDVLAAGARGPEGVDAKLCRVEHDLVHRIGFRQDRDGAGGSVDAPLCLGLGHALDAVAARLELEPRINALAGDANDHFLVAAELRRTLRDELDLPAL